MPVKSWANGGTFGSSGSGDKDSSAAGGLGGLLGGLNGSGGGGSTPASNPNSGFTWGGAKPSSTFDPKTAGTTFFSDLMNAYGKGPQAPIPSFNPFTAQTKGLIDQGLGQVASNAGGPLKDFASGKYLDGSNDPYFNANLQTARDNTTRDVNSSFNSTGRYGSDIHASGLANGLDTAENAARSTQLTNEWNQMLGAQNQLAGNTATGLGYSGLLDSKNAEQIASNREQQAATDPYNYISKYLGLLNGNSGQNAQNTNQPVSLWNILGGVGSVLGSFL